jgi:ketosteroid isomerase-like protein
VRARRAAVPLALALLAGSASLVAGATGGETAVDSLVQAEQAFARASVEKGMKEAFLAFLAEDAILFRPGPIPGKAWLRDRPAPAIVLSWRPVFAEASRAGDLGFTLGPWELRSQDPKDTEVAYGTFATVWRRQADGGWKVAVDLGTSGPKAAQAAEAVGAAAPVEKRDSPGAPAKVDMAAETAKLLAADRELSLSSAVKGAAAAFHGHLAPQVRLLRDGAAPARGPEAAEAELARHPGKLTWEPAGGGVSASGDLGYTYGTADLAPTPPTPTGAPARSAYQRLWERVPGGGWKVVVDVMNPFPPPPPPKPGS